VALTGTRARRAAALGAVGTLLALALALWAGGEPAAETGARSSGASAGRASPDRAGDTVDWGAARDEAAALLARLVRIDTSNPPGDEAPAAFEELLRVADENVLVLARDDLAQDRRRLREVASGEFDHLLVAVKSWEPPEAELADLLGELRGMARCTIYLLPLPGRPVPHRKVEDWRGFTRALHFPVVDVRLLNRVPES